MPEAVKLPDDWKPYAAVLGGALVIVLTIYFVGKHELGQALPAVGNAINPVNPNNIFNQGAGAVATTIAGHDESAGTYLYELFHSEPDLSAPVPVPAQPVSAEASAGGAF